MPSPPWEKTAYGIRSAWPRVGNRVDRAGEFIMTSYVFLAKHSRPDDWIDRVNQALTASELTAIGRSIGRGTPLGTPTWVRETAGRLALEHTLRSPGRPRIAGVRQAN